MLIAAGSALAGGLLSVTFVAVVGGAVMMGRLRGAGLPTEIGVALQSRSVLLSVGAEVLAAAIVVAIVAAFVVHFAGWIGVVVPPPDRVATARPAGVLRTRPLRARVTDSLPRLVSRHNLLAVAVTVLGCGYYIVWSAGAFHFPLQTGVAAMIFIAAGATGYVCGQLASTAVVARDRRRARNRPIEAPRDAEEGRLARIEIVYLAGLAATIMCFATVAAVTASLTDPEVRPVAVLFNGVSGRVVGDVAA